MQCLRKSVFTISTISHIVFDKFLFDKFLFDIFPVCMEKSSVKIDWWRYDVSYQSIIIANINVLNTLKV